MYEYTVALETDSSMIVTNGTTMMTSIQLSVVVLAYVEYRFNVTARTGGGLGVSASEVEFSPEAGKCVCVLQ